MSDHVDYKTYLKNLVPENYLNIALDSHKTYENSYRILFEKKKIPENGWTDQQIEQLVNYLSSLDSNNFLNKCGVGEREARIVCNLVAKRHYNFGHGIGRSGDLDEPQPKAVGSTILNRLTNAMVLNLIQIMGIRQAKKAILIPMATGMTLSLCMSSFKQQRPQAKYVLWSRIDQKSCFKSIIAANLVPIIIDQIAADDVDGGLQTNVEKFAEKIHEFGAENIVCLFTTTSCFAPRQCDNIAKISKLVNEFNIPHLINNAYGLQSRYLANKINNLHNEGHRLDLFVQSTDKNLMCPVGGSIVAGFNENLVKNVGQMYAGRASATQSLDVFMTLLSLGRNGYLSLVNQRKELFEYFQNCLKSINNDDSSSGIILHVISVKSNPISISFTIDGLTANGINVIGSMLFKRNVSGARAITGDERKIIDSYEFIGWGSHTSMPIKPYITVAAGLGITKEDIDSFVVKLKKCILLNSDRQKLIEKDEVIDKS